MYSSIRFTNEKYIKPKIERQQNMTILGMTSLLVLAGCTMLISYTTLACKSFEHDLKQYNINNINNYEEKVETTPYTLERYTSTSENIADNTENYAESGVENTEDTIESKDDLQLIRCTGYVVKGYTKSGEWVRPGGVAGKQEWLGKSCNIYEVDPDGNKGDLIGTYDFNDTGFGLEELDGIYYPNGTIPEGMSIDIWHDTVDEVWEWASTYGDYVYMELLN